MIPESTRRQLRFVRVSEANISLGRFPDFLIVGPQRTGTTWLHAQLRFHPQIFLSEPKELFFFSSLETPDSRRFQSDELSWYLQFFRDPAWRALAKTAICLWKYGRLYRPIVRGEATASYAVLGRDVIQDIVALNPRIKVILTVRDPVERAWSHAKKDLIRNRGRDPGSVSDEEFRAFFDEPHQRRCARYVECCDNWGAYLRPGHLFVGFFDDIARRPEEFLLDVMSFLGVASERRYISRDARQSVNRTETSAVPPHHRKYLEELLRDDVDRLRARFGRG